MRGLPAEISVTVRTECKRAGKKGEVILECRLEINSGLASGVCSDTDRRVLLVTCKTTPGGNFESFLLELIDIVAFLTIETDYSQESLRHHNNPATRNRALDGRLGFPHWAHLDRAGSPSYAA